MAFSLDNVVPWGRSYDEYLRMFSLRPTDLDKRILGCGDGPASFNAQMHRQGFRVVSVDPLYRFPARDIAARIEATRDTILEQLEARRDDFVWNDVGSAAELGALRMSAMAEFLDDFPAGLEEERYIVGELPALPFADRRFDLALCSHLLFLYSDHLCASFHRAAVGELCRVAGEVRIFPLLTLAGDRSPCIDEVIAGIEAAGGRWSIEKVSYKFQRGGDEMLVIRAGNGGRTGR